MLDQAELIRQALRLRRAHRRHPTDEDLTSVRVEIERAAGHTIGRATSARLLGVSQTALDRWVATGDVPAVLTPRGRREVPVPALLDLLDAVEAYAAARRPLAAALRARRGNADASVVAPHGHDHRTAELRSLAYHRAVADRLDDASIADALVRLRRWRGEGRIHPRYADAWETLLTGPRGRMRTALIADDDDAAALRQSSPFAGVLDEHERRALLGLTEGRVA